jgi:hypothetical protein
MSQNVLKGEDPFKNEIEFTFQKDKYIHTICIEFHITFYQPGDEYLTCQIWLIFSQLDGNIQTRKEKKINHRGDSIQPH